MDYQIFIQDKIKKLQAIKKAPLTESENSKAQYKLTNDPLGFSLASYLQDNYTFLQEVQREFDSPDTVSSISESQVMSDIKPLWEDLGLTQSKCLELFESEAKNIELDDIDAFAQSKHLSRLIRVPRRISRSIQSGYMLNDKKCYLSKEDIRLLLGILSEVNNATGEINGLTPYSLIHLVMQKFIFKTNFHAFLKSFKRLIVAGYISYSYDDKKLTVLNYAEEFSKNGQSMGSFVMPLFIFYMTKDFSTAAYRLLLKWMDQIGGLSPRDPIHMKITDNLIKDLRKRCPEDVRKVIDELRSFFDITGDDMVFHIRLKKQYQMREDLLKGIKQHPCAVSQKKSKDVYKLAANIGIIDKLYERCSRHGDEKDFEDLDIKDAFRTLMQKLNAYTMGQIHKILILMRDGLHNIRSIGAYLHTLIELRLKDKPSAELERNKMKKLFKEFFHRGHTVEDIEAAQPGIFEYYKMLWRLG